MYPERVSLLRRLSRFPPPRAMGTAPAARSPTPRVSLDQLRAHMDLILARRPPSEPIADAAWPELPFVTEPTNAGDLHVRSLRMDGHRVGHAPVCLARIASAALLSLLALDPSLARCDPDGALYLDTETTGLAGGTGTVAFLVGLAWFERGALVLEQLLVKNLGEEAPMLARVAERVAASTLLVTFNGKSFDLPLLRTRFVMARMRGPVEPPHLDLLHLARRVHAGRKRRSFCLTALEREVLGFEREGDVPSGDVAAHYLHFLRTGDTTALLSVVEHNAWDVATMAALVGLYGEPLEGSRLVPADLVGVARTLRRAGDVDLAYDTADRAVRAGAGPESVRARGEIANARGDKARALADFEAYVAGVDDASARLELAKLYEHHVKDPERALALVDRGTGETEAALGRRRARLDRKAERRRALACGSRAEPGADVESSLFDVRAKS